MSPSTRSAPSALRAVVLGQQRRIGLHVVVEEQQQLARWRPRRRRCGPAPRRWFSCSITRSGKETSQLAQRRGGAVGRAVDDDDHLEVAYALAVERGDRAHDYVAPLVGRDDDAETRHLPRAPRGAVRRTVRRQALAGRARRAGRASSGREPRLRLDAPRTPAGEPGAARPAAVGACARLGDHRARAVAANRAAQGRAARRRSGRVAGRLLEQPHSVPEARRACSR